MSQRATYSEYGIHWKTLAKMLQHAEPSGYRPSKLDVYVRPNC